MLQRNLLLGGITMVVSEMYNQFLMKLLTIFTVIGSTKEHFVNTKMQVVQRNAAVWWVLVVVVVVILAAFVAACKLAGGEFTGEFKFFGAYFKVQCKN